MPKDTFNVVVKKVELLVRKINTLIPDPIDVALDSVAINYLWFSLFIILIQVESYSGIKDPSQIRQSFFPGLEMIPCGVT